jgi:galactose oxidase-like protein/Kelch motif protein
MRFVKWGMVVSALTILCQCNFSGGAPINLLSTSRLIAVGNLKVARAGHTATMLPNGKVLITGGGSGGGFLASAEIFDPGTNTFRQIANMTTRRAGHTATLLGNGTVLIIGGADGAGRTLASAEIFDPATESFTAAASMGTARTDHSATLLPDGRVLVAGGSAVWPNSLATAELYDPNTGKFTPTASMNEARRPAGVVLLKNGEVLICGGTGQNRIVLASAELYDPGKGVFTTIGNMTTRRHKHAASVLADGSVLITGGSDERDWENVYRSAEIFDAAKKEFRPLGDMNSAHFKHYSLALPDGRIVVIGGSNSVEIYDPAVRRFEVASGDLGKPYYFPSATVLDGSRVLISGGYDRNNTATNGAWILQTSTR